MNRLLLPIALALLACGCVSVKNDNTLVPPPGLCSDIDAPLTAFKTPLNLEGLKKGTATENIFIQDWLFTGISVSLWETTLEKAMLAAGITKLRYADYHQRSILGFYTEFTVTAYGE